MIAQLRGLLAQKTADRLVIDVQGVGYEVLVPFSTYYELGEVGETVVLHIHTHVREDSLTLYGFRTPEEKKLFMSLIQISGVGPRMGVMILSGLPVNDFTEAVSAGDISRLSSVPGVGKKTAERITLEMKDKVGMLFPEVETAEVSLRGGRLQNDVVSALVNFGYLRSKAETAVSRAIQEEDTDRFDVVLRMALKELSS
jgi:Holliday junction DNA helicase RuvA